jgi:hypothetical protein
MEQELKTLSVTGKSFHIVANDATEKDKLKANRTGTRFTKQNLTNEKDH